MNPQLEAVERILQKPIIVRAIDDNAPMNVQRGTCNRFATLFDVCHNKNNKQGQEFPNYYDFPTNDCFCRLQKCFCRRTMK